MRGSVLAFLTILAFTVSMPLSLRAEDLSGKAGESDIEELPPIGGSGESPDEQHRRDRDGRSRDSELRDRGDREWRPREKRGDGERKRRETRGEREERDKDRRRRDGDGGKIGKERKTREELREEREESKATRREEQAKLRKERAVERKERSGQYKRKKRPENGQEEVFPWELAE